MPITLVVEDGSGNPLANAYDTQAHVATYHLDRGNDYWASVTSENQKACIIRATDFIDKRFRQSFRGFRMTRDQSLAWPRLSAFDDDRYMYDGVPLLLRKALAEYALRTAIYNVLSPDPLRPVPREDMVSVTPLGDQTELIVGPVRTKTEKVGPVETIIAYDSPAQYRRNTESGNSRSTQSNVVNDLFIPQYPEADMLIEPLLDNHEASTSLERA